MTEAGQPKITELIQSDDDALDVCMAFLLLWLAATDGRLSRQSLNYLYQHHESLPRALDRADKLLAIIAANDMDSYLHACRSLQSSLPVEDHQSFLHRAIATATASGGLSIAANHTLRFVADLLGYGQEDLALAYKECTRQELPEPGDPSSMEWWQRRDAEESSAPPPGQPVSRRDAFVILGLNSDASHSAVKQAYRRLVQNYHPDRVAGLDAGARSLAEGRFLQVQQAYELLRQ